MKNKAEENLVVEPAIELLQNLGYQYLSSQEADQQRENLKGGVLIRELERKLKHLNPWISEENIFFAVRAITHINATPLIEANQKAYEILTQGITVLQNLEGGTARRAVQFIDFDEPENNSFIITKDLIVQGTINDFVRLDLVVFINGLPLAVIECKNPFSRQPIESAIEQLRRYQELTDDWQGRGAALLMHTVQILIATCRDKAVFGSIGALPQTYSSFPYAYPISEVRFRRFLMREPSAQDTLLYSLLEPSNLLEYTRSLVVFEQERSNKVKLLARHYQRVAIDQAIKRIQGTTDPRERGGVIWHTQGSGKSLTMFWLVQKLRQANLNLGNSIIIIVTDRLEAEGWIARTFQDAGSPTLQRASSVKHLQELLEKGKGSTILTTLQKFYNATRSKQELNTGSEVFVLVDEAHRSQHGSLAARMRTSLPNATYIAFSSTSIDKKDRNTVRLFGNYIHKYTMPDAIRDRVSIPILYEKRYVQTNLVELGEAYSATDNLNLFDVEDQESFHRLLTSLSSPQRMSTISQDLTQHFQQHIQPNGFKGLLVTSSREAAAHYKQELDELEAPESAVIFTTSHNDPEWIRAYYTSLTEREQLLYRFKDPSDPLSILIVVDMLLTGFDAPILQVMYLDAPLREHTLLQAVARVNRPYPGKEAGIVVDYCGIESFLVEALQMFDADEEDIPIANIDEEKPILRTHHRAVMRFFQGVDRLNFKAALKGIEDKEARNRFEQSYEAFTRSMNLLLPDPEALKLIDDLKWLSQVREIAHHHFKDEEVDWGNMPPKILQIVGQDASSDELRTTLQFTDTPATRSSNGNLNSSHPATARNGIDETRETDLDRKINLFLPVFREQDVSEALAAKLAQVVNTTIHGLIVVDWITKDDVQREMRRQLRRALLSNLPRGDVEAIIQNIMNIARKELA